MHLDVTKGTNGDSDVTNKTAVFFAPYNNERLYWQSDFKLVSRLELGSHLPAEHRR